MLNRASLAGVLPCSGTGRWVTEKGTGSGRLGVIGAGSGVDRVEVGVNRAEVGVEEVDGGDLCCGGGGVVRHCVVW